MISPRIGWWATLVVAILAALFLLFPEAGSAEPFSLFLAPVYSVDSMSVYQSSSTAVGSGTAVCTGVDVSGASASCDTNLSTGTSYRFEVVVSNSSNPDNGTLGQFLFQGVYSASDVLGSNASLSACGCFDDGVDKPGSVSFTGQDANCVLPSVDPCVVEKGGGTETLYFVVSTGSDAASGSGSFFVEQAGEGSDTSADISFSYCMVACGSNSGCDDGNSLTTDVCSSPGTCSSACSNSPCSVECVGDSGCDDSNPITTVVCNDPGTCAASCSNTSCAVACSSNGDCSDSNSLTIDVCLSPGTCGSSCTNTPCDVNCAVNADCDDSNGFTSDACSSPGTCSAACTYVSCTPLCFNSAGCDDNISTTVDVCNNAGTCDANCSNTTCTPTCFDDSGCDDGIPATVDTCIHPGGCGAHCLNEYCSPACSSDSDCDDSDPLTDDSCLNAGSCTASCSNEACDIACSSDSGCDDSDPLTEDKCSGPGTCDAACTHEEFGLLVELVSDIGGPVGRGQPIDLNVLVTDPGGNPVEGAVIWVAGPSGTRVDLNSVGNGYYSGRYVVPVDAALGSQVVSLSASASGLSGLGQLSLEVGEGIISAVLLDPSEPRAFVGQKVGFSFRLVYGDGSPALGADANASLNGVSVPLSKGDGAVFSGSYLFSEADLGSPSLVVSAADSLGNGGSTSISFSVEQPFPLELLAFVAALVAVVALVVYGLRRTHLLSSLLAKRGSISLSVRKKQLQKAIEKDKSRIKALHAEIGRCRDDLKRVNVEIEAERKRQALAVSKLPSESRYAAHKAAVGFSARLGRLFGGGVSPKERGRLARLERIDADVSALRVKIRALEGDYCRKAIKEDAFRSRLFDLRERVHLLELERKKIE